MFSSDQNGKPTISYIDQFPEPKNMEQGLFLQKLSDALEESKNKIIFPLPPGSAVFSNNYFSFWNKIEFQFDNNLKFLISYLKCNRKVNFYIIKVT